MHELAITESILNITLETAEKYNAAKVTEVKITIGEMSSIVPACVQEYFNLLSEDTVASHAKLTFNIVPAMIHCNDCGKDSHVEHFRIICPLCQSRNTTVCSGKEFYVDSIDIED